MPVIRRGDKYRVEPPVFEKLAVISVGSCVRGFVAGFIDPGGVYVAECGDIGLTRFDEVPHHMFAASTAADDAEAESIVGAEHLRVRGG